MEIKDYIKSAKASGQTSEQIEAALIKAGWPREQIKSYIVTPVILGVAIPENEHKKSVTSKLKLIGFVLIAMSIILPIIKLIAINNTLIDEKYGFKLRNIMGWRKVGPWDNANYSLEVVPNLKYSFPVATVSIAAEPNTYLLGKSEKELKVFFSKSCRELAVTSNLQYLRIESLSIPDTNSFKCTFQERNKNKHGDISIQIQVFIIKKKYNIIMSAFYLKNFPEGLSYIDRLIGEFQVID